MWYIILGYIVLFLVICFLKQRFDSKLDELGSARKYSQNQEVWERASETIWGRWFQRMTWNRSRSGGNRLLVPWWMYWYWGVIILALFLCILT